MTILRKLRLVQGLLLASFIAVLLFSYCPAAAQQEQRLYRIKVNNLIGFIDQTGKVVIQPMLRDARNFQEGLAAARPAGSEQWGFVDQTGQFVIAPRYFMAGNFSEGLAAFRLERQGRIGFLDHKGEVVIPPRYSQTRSFKNGRAAVRIDDNRVAFIDKTGVVVLQTDVEYVADFMGDLIPFALQGAFQVGEKDHWGFMAQDGTIVIAPKYDSAAPFQVMITPVRLNGKTGFIDKAGSVIVDFSFDTAMTFSEGMAVVSKKSGNSVRCGYIDATGNLAIPLQFEAACSFSEGLAAVKVNDRWGFIDKAGNMVIRPQYLNRLSGPSWKPVSPLIEFHEGLAVVGTETGNAYINRAGEIIIPPAFLWYGSFADGLASVFDGRQTVGYIDKQGKYVWKLNQM